MSHSTQCILDFLLASVQIFNLQRASGAYLNIIIKVQAHPPRLYFIIQNDKIPDF